MVVSISNFEHIFFQMGWFNHQEGFSASFPMCGTSARLACMLWALPMPLLCPKPQDFSRCKNLKVILPCGSESSAKWPTFKLLGIPYLVGKIKLKLKLKLYLWLSKVGNKGMKVYMVMIHDVSWNFPHSLYSGPATKFLARQNPSSEKKSLPSHQKNPLTLRF